MPITKAIPVLCVTDLEAASAFYERLGFARISLYPDYAVFVHAKAELHLRTIDGPLDENPCGAYFLIGDADALAVQLQAAGVTLIGLSSDRPYGLREFTLSDPWGNLLRFLANYSMHLHRSPDCERRIEIARQIRNLR